MNQKAFISLVAPLAMEQMRKSRIPASLTIAQAILESSWGKSELAIKANNLFGIKGTGPAGSYYRVSREFEANQKVEKGSFFKKYHSWDEGIRDRTQFLLKPIYAKVIGADWRTACLEVYEAGYATDPEYPQKLLRLIEQHKLYEYDLCGEDEQKLKIIDMYLTNKNARPGRKITPQGVVIHWTANEKEGADAEANRHYFNKPTTVASAHYCVDDKEIVRCLPENEMGYHVGAKSYAPAALQRLSSYPNDCTIGTEMCVNSDGDFDAMYQNTLELTADILKRYGWGVDRLWRHFDVTGKNCPAYFVSDDFARRFTGLTAQQAWAKFKDDVQRVLKGNPQPAEKSVDKPVDKVSIEINGNVLPVQGYLKDGVSTLPVRAVAEATGVTPGWCPDNKAVTVNDKQLTVTIEAGTSYAPAREIAAALDLQVEWIQETKTVKLKGCVCK
ncbi:glucosaminidase domain-containing protein [Brevibacillus sp. NPDC003359]|uniref:glucosaminidase domain-containing protein n=1 Tax=unclassified Brevibacillus TaxID=2684853 RepID=UPI00369E3171